MREVDIGFWRHAAELPPWANVADLPIWAAIPVALLLLAGAGFALTGSIGLLRLKDFYERLHAPTIGTSYGMACILLASVIFFSVLQTRLVLHEVLIGILVLATTPVTLMLVARAALHRDRLESHAGVPPPRGEPGPGDTAPEPAPAAP
jgi:multicomponent K+:H+ antiporter subunit G